MANQTIAAEVFRPDAWALGEGPFWFEHQLWWVDIEKGLLLSANPSGHLTHRHALGQRIGSAAPIRSGHLIVALENELAHLDLQSSQCTPLAHPAGPPNHRFNDGKCDPFGRFFVGTTSLSGEPKTSALYVLEKDPSLRVIKTGVSISNGMAWSKNGRTFYYIDTPTRCVAAFDYDGETGTLSGERVALRFSEADGWPDGMTIDQEDRLWIAFWDGAAVRCYDPSTAQCEAEIKLPCSRPTSCCFGGDGLSQLFITTARVGLNEGEQQAQPLAGAVFTCEPGTRGLPVSPAYLPV